MMVCGVCWRTADGRHASYTGADAAAAGGVEATAWCHGRARAGARGDRSVGWRARRVRRPRRARRRRRARRCRWGRGAGCGRRRCCRRHRQHLGNATTAAARRRRGAPLCQLRPQLQRAGGHDGAQEHARHVWRGRLPVPSLRQGAQGLSVRASPLSTLSLSSCVEADECFRGGGAAAGAQEHSAWDWVHARRRGGSTQATFGQGTRGGRAVSRGAKEVRSILKAPVKQGSSTEAAFPKDGGQTPLSLNERPRACPKTN